MLIKCLRSEPEVFETVFLEAGVNIITGERSGSTKSGNKTNGVGKTLFMCFIDFCLLADYKKGRISKIPSKILGNDTNIILELLSSDKKTIVIKRNIQAHDKPSIYIDGQKQVFSSLDDARKYLFHHFFSGSPECSFRELIKIFKRTELTGYIEIDSPDGLQKNPRNILPYLYVFKLNIDLYQNIIKKAEDLIDAYDYAKELKKEIERTTDIKKAAAYVNDLKKQVDDINIAVENLSQHEVYSVISDDISALDIKISECNLRLVALKEEIKQIEYVPEYQDISDSDLLAVYNDCKNSLGDLIVKDLQAIKEFKEIIDKFKNDILYRRREELKSLLEEESQKIKLLSQDYKEKTAILEQGGNLRSLKISLQEQYLKKQEYDRLAFFYEKYDEQTNKKVILTAERATALSDFKKDIDLKNDILHEFQDKFLEIYCYLYGNNKASFKLDIKPAKKYDQKIFACFDIEVGEEGSVRTAHEKALIFDLALLFFDRIKDRHMRILMHDGAFEGVNEDTKFQLLNWLHECENKDFQYIITINRDSFEALETQKKFAFDLNSYIRKQYTKEDRFLKCQYTEQKN